MSDLTDVVDGIVHEETQVGDRGLDLTVDSIHHVTVAGEVDFGGDEMEPAETTELPAEKREEDDEYGWWNLDSSQYLVEYNESLDADEPLVLQTRRAVLDRGAFHPTLHVTDLGRVPLSVADDGLDLKENARISTLFER